MRELPQPISDLICKRSALSKSYLMNKENQCTVMSGIVWHKQPEGYEVWRLVNNGDFEPLYAIHPYLMDEKKKENTGLFKRLLNWITK